MSATKAWTAEWTQAQSVVKQATSNAVAPLLAEMTAIRLEVETEQRRGEQLRTKLDELITKVGAQ
jgi:hypothetical protein